MLAIIADLYSPLLALFCVYYLRARMSKNLAFSFIVAYLAVYGFAFIEFHFGWWLAMGANFSSHTAVVMVIVCALLSFSFSVGFYAFISVFIYGWLMTALHYHSWFDIFSTMILCLPCWGLFFIAKRASSQHANVKV